MPATQFIKQSLFAVAGSNSSIVYTISSPTIYKQGVLSTTKTVIFEDLTASPIILENISVKLVNVTNTIVSGIIFYYNGTSLMNQITGSISIPPNGSATYTKDGKWDIYNSTGSSVNLGSSRMLLYKQTTSTSTWTIVHNFNAYPVSVQVTDSGGSVVYGNIQIIDSNTIELTFSSSFLGEARIQF